MALFWGCRVLSSLSFNRHFLRAIHTKSLYRNHALLRDRSPKYYSNSFGNRYLATTADIAKADNPSPISGEKRYTTSADSVDREIEILDKQVQRYGRVDHEQVEELLAMILRKGSVTEQQSLMLMRCCGQLMVKASGEERTQCFEKIWETLQSIGAHYGIQHYNTAMRIHLENDHQISPAQSLASIEAKELVPNRITYQLLIMKYCEEGDLEGARKILDYMKSQDMSISEAVFSAIIKGHFKKSDVEGAEAVLGSMREVGLEPTSQSYAALLCGYAENGDISSIHRVLKAAEKDEATVHPSQLFDALFELVDHGHSQHMEELLQLVREYRAYNQDALNCMFNLVVHGHDDEAWEVLQIMDSSVLAPSDRQENVSSRTILRTMVIRERPVEKVMKMVERINQKSGKEFDLTYLPACAIKFDKHSYTLEILKELKTRGLPIRQHYFWPVLQACAKAQDKAGLYNCVKQLLELWEGTSQTELNTLVNNMVVVPLLKMKEDFDDVMLKLQEIGSGNNLLQALKMIQLVREGKPSEALEIGKSTDVKISSQILKGILQQDHLDCKNDLSYITQLAAEFSVGSAGELREMRSVLLLKITRDVTDAQQLETLISSWEHQKFKVKGGIISQVENNIKEKGVSSETIEKLKRLGDTGDARNTDMLERIEMVQPKAMNSMSTEKLEDLHDQYSARRMNTMSLEKRLLQNYCTSGDVDKAEKLQKKLDNQGFVYNAEMLRSLGTLASRYKEDLEEAITFKEAIETQYPQFEAYGGLVLHIMVLMLRKGQTEEAVNMLKVFVSEKRNDGGDGGLRDSFLLAPVSEILLDITAKSSPALTREISQILFDSGLVKKGTFSILKKIMEAELNSEDNLDGIVSAMEECVSTYGKTPHFTAVFNLLITKEDAVRLQKVVDLVSTVLGEMAVLNHLIGSFVECGKLKQANKIVETPGLRALMPVLAKTCDRFRTGGKVKNMEDFFSVTKHLFAVDKDEILFQLIRLHANHGAPNKALDVMTLYEENNFSPRPRTLRYLAKVLTNAGQPVPFEVPEIPQDVEKTSTKSGKREAEGSSSDSDSDSSSSDEEDQSQKK